MPAPAPRVRDTGIINHERDGLKRALQEVCHLLTKIIALPPDHGKAYTTGTLPLPATGTIALT
ncbi:hypothetical protein GCM10010082_21660 [Kushneria pakistanensis]|uniref:Uncharacterized protein n=1 Tax=Kushneria pakistanensis TaxID=1508770 RepID=A0ABQ3FKE9_9GAMM|nr:hypothetical protein GCM10010082_21660 [Kushneria pakistanensis]